MKPPVRPLFNTKIMGPYFQGRVVPGRTGGLSSQEDGAKEEKKMKRLTVHLFKYRR
jgi:hypothetical protein